MDPILILRSAATAPKILTFLACGCPLHSDYVLFHAVPRIRSREPAFVAPPAAGLSISTFSLFSLSVCAIQSDFDADKVDKLNAMESAVNIKRLQEAFELPPGLPVSFSAVTGQGKKEIWSYIRQAAAASRP